MKKYKNILLVIVAVVLMFTIFGCKTDKPPVKDEFAKVKEQFESLELIQFSSGDTKDNVTKNFQVLEQLEEYKIYWNIIGEGLKKEGNAIKVTRNVEDILVNLEATILISDSVFYTKEYQLVIIKDQSSPLEKEAYNTFHDGKSLIQLSGEDTLTSINENISLLDNINNYKINWAIEGSGIKLEDNVGVVTKTLKDQDIKLIATINLPNLGLQTKEFNLKVLAHSSGEVYTLTLPNVVTADISDLEAIIPGTDVTLTVSNPSNQQYLVFVNEKYQSYDDNNELEIEVNEDTVVTVELAEKTTSIFNARKMMNEEVTLKGIITGIIPDDSNELNYYYYLNDGTAAIAIRTQAYPELEVGDLILSPGTISDYFNNIIFYPHGNDIVIKKNQKLPDSIYVNNVSKGTLDYENLSLQAQRFDIEDLHLKEKITSGVNFNFFVEDNYGNEVQIRFHKHLDSQTGNKILAKVKDLEIGDSISLSGAHLMQFKRNNDPYIIQFMISDADEIVINDQKPRYIITFDLDNGESNVSFTVAEGTKIPLAEIPRPYKYGYQFTGWYIGTTEFDFNQTVTSNLTIKATWTESEDPDNPTDPNSQIVIDNQNSPVVKNYYNSINFNTSNSQLHTNLKSLVYARELGYDAAKKWLLEADRDINNPNKLRGIYDQVLFNRAWDGAATWNREHVWPQSKLGGAGKGEAHNLRVSGVRINSTRGNMPFSENASSTGTLGYRIGSYWWPGSIDKGDVARILMFMYLRHGLRLNDSTGDMGQLSLLLKWHREDPVDAFEIQRNNVIHIAQGNRNPFIDHPEVFEKIWNHARGNIQASINFIEVANATKLEYKNIQTTINLTFFRQDKTTIGA